MADKAIRRLLEVDVYFISLVSSPANKKGILFKSKEEESVEIWKSDIDTADFNEERKFEKTIEFTKTDKTQHMVYGIVYSPDEVDTYGDTANEEVIKNMSNNFMKHGRTPNVDKNHNYESDKGFVAGNWIIEDGDKLKMFKNVKIGTWVVAIKIEDETLWTAIEDGRIVGISMAGYAQTEDIEDEDKKEQKSILDKVKSLIGNEEKAGKVISAKNEKKITEVIKLLQDLIGDEKMKKEILEDNTEEVELTENTEENENTEELEEIEKSESENEEIELEIEEDENEEDKKYIELTEQLKKLKADNEKLAKEVETLKNSSNGLQAIEDQEEEVNKSKDGWASIHLVPSQFRN